MKKTRLFLSVLALASCDLIQLGSRYVKTQYIDASGGTVAVATSDDRELAGVSLEIPAGAVSQRTLITVEPAIKNLVTESESVSLGVRWGPNDVNFTIPATVRIPVDAVTGSLAEDFEAVLETGYDVSAYDVTFDSDKRTVSFKISHLGSFQVRERPRQCGPKSPCPPSMVCVHQPRLYTGVCQPGPDGGVRSCTSSDGCGSAEECVNGVCELRGRDGGACEPRVDGGITCNSGADCPVDVPYCFNCQCHRFCPACETETCDHRDGGYVHPPFDGGNTCPPHFDGGFKPPYDGGFDPPYDGGFDPPYDGGACVPDVDGGICRPSFDGGFDPPSYDGGFSDGGR